MLQSTKLHRRTLEILKNLKGEWRSQPPSPTPKELATPMSMVTFLLEIHSFAPLTSGPSTPLRIALRVPMKHEHGN